MRILLTAFLAALLLSNCSSEHDASTSLTLDSVTSLEVGSTFRFHSDILDEDRLIIVLLPEGYEENDANYPVLYLTDGMQNIWHVKGAVEVLTRTGSMPPTIVVGIASTNRDRDFSPTANENWPRSGGGPQFLDFIEKELIPRIDANYRTHPYRILEGHSLGGLFAASALINRPELFDAYIIMSPSFWWNDQEIIHQAADFFKSQTTLDKAIFFGIGKLESDSTWGMRKELQNFIDVLQSHQPEKLRFKHMELEDEGHMSSPLLSNYYGLKYIFLDMKLPEELIANYSDEAFLNHENRIMSKYGAAAKQSAESYVEIASYLIVKNDDMDGAITVMKRGVEAYPFDLGLIDFLAKVYNKNKNTAKAIETYKHAIAVSEQYNYGREEEFQTKIGDLQGE